MDAVTLLSFMDTTKSILEDQEDTILRTRIELANSKLLSLKEILTIEMLLNEQGIKTHFPEETLNFTKAKIATSGDILVYILRIPVDLGKFYPRYPIHRGIVAVLTILCLVLWIATSLDTDSNSTGSITLTQHIIQRNVWTTDVPDAAHEPPVSTSLQLYQQTPDTAVPGLQRNTKTTPDGHLTQQVPNPSIR